MRTDQRSRMITRNIKGSRCTFFLLLTTFIAIILITLLAMMGDKHPNPLRVHNWQYTADETVLPLKHTCNEAASLWVAENDNRKRRVKNTCIKRGLANKFQKLNSERNFLYVDDIHGLIFCVIPKVGCTSWQKSMVVLSRQWRKEDAMKPDIHYYDLLPDLITLDKFSEYGREYRLKNYLKVMFVRHPMERILSGYRDKLEDPSSHYGHLRENILKRYKNKSEVRNGTRIPSFSALAHYIIDTKEGLDNHFRQYENTCLPCQIPYDVIGKFETYTNDAWNVLKLVRAEKDFSLPKNSSHNSATKTSLLVPRYMHKLNKQERRDLWKKYELDADLFGYTLDSVLTAPGKTQPN